MKKKLILYSSGEESDKLSDSSPEASYPESMFDGPAYGST
jgi:hypothetical protein